ncbi:alpha/beta fold hydrolase [Sandaracinobacteroides hominis]|uniref:alpha/beta fold hydrolase n=1 Tax=Sandaracinobacteroides hominis TaxID=2780086 RepID=UPI0018F5FD98|nr:alpha/beta hydrolase [Sandaracinobacteroides hominis]
MPKDAIVGREAMADGAQIRTLLFPHEQPIANLLLLTGRADFHEKWADAIRLLHDEGFAIASFDWRGQGGSTRLTDSGAGHIDSFDTWLSDLDRLSGWAMESLGQAPWLALGHSMGGHLLTRWIADPARTDLPLRRDLQGAILAAPFYGMGGPMAMKAAAMRLAPLQVARGLQANFAWGQRPYGRLQQRPERQLLLTGSRAHFEDEGLWVAARPELATGGVSWGWIKAFADSQRQLEALPLEQVQLPLMVLMASNERLVDNKATMRIAARLPNAERHIVEGAAHELLREAEPARRAALQKIREFTLDRLA